MTLSIESKRQRKTPHRRATVDTPSSLTSTFANLPKPIMRRQLSLPLIKKGPVQFSELSEVCVLERSSANKRWYNSEDHQRMKRERVQDVAMFRNQARQKQKNQSAPAAAPAAPSNPDTDGANCPVGIEQLLSSRGMLEAHSNRETVIKSVLLEQNRQRTWGFQDPDQIALASFRFSAQAFEGAQKRGKFQEMAKFME